MKAAIEAEKNKNKDMILKLEAKNKNNETRWVTRVFRCIDLKKELKDQSQIIDKLKSALEAEKAINREIKLASENEKKAKLAVKTVTNAKLRLESQQSIISNLKFNLVDIDTKLKLMTVAELQLRIDNLLSNGVDRKDAVIKNLKVKIDIISKLCSICMLNDVNIYFDPCGHTYCSSCFKTSYNCLKCKSVMKINDRHV